MDSNDWCVVRSRVLLGRIRLDGLQLDPLRVDRLLLNTLLVPEEVFLSSTGIFFLSLGEACPGECRPAKEIQN